MYVFGFYLTLFMFVVAFFPLPQISPMMMSLYWVYASVTILITLVIIILIFIEQ